MFPGEIIKNNFDQTTKIDFPYNKIEDNHDGFWEIIQDWSTCSQACGGGT
jgi:hypothetical protein